MKTLHLKPDQSGLFEAVQILKGAGIVAVPTETVYGLAADALDEKAVAKIFSAKGRPQNNPLIVHTDTLENAQKLFTLVTPLESERLKKLACAFWPGPLTIVAQKAPHIPSITTGGLATVGVRIPRHDATLKIMSMLGLPLAMPSANQSTRPSPTSVKHVLTTLDGRIDAIVVGESCDVGIESTIVRIDGHKPVLLRLGMISQSMIEKCLGENVETSMHNKGERPEAPGCAYLHYSPSVASVRLTEMAEAHDWWAQDVMLLMREGDYDALQKVHGLRQSAFDQVLSDDPHVFAKQLYGALHACEDRPQKHLVIVLPPADSAFSAIRDRLQRTERLQSL